jgi:hypothetical protein
MFDDKYVFDDGQFYFTKIAIGAMVLEDCDMVTSKQIKQMLILVYTCIPMLAISCIQ